MNHARNVLDSHAAGRSRGYSFAIGKKSAPSFQIKPLAAPDPLQAAILKDWPRQIGRGTIFV